jgi:HSP20 family protein
MPHFKFDPIRELDDLSDRMRKFAQEFPESFSIQFGRGFEPRVDMLQDAEGLRISVELPGVPRENVKLTLADNVLLLEGGKSEPAGRENATLVRGERSFGPFQRRIELPVKVDPSSIAAAMLDGVLTVTLRSAAAASATDIPIDIH